MENINHRSFKQDWQSRRRDLVSLMLYLLVYGAALITFVGIAFTVGYILVKGLPNLNMSLFAWTYNSENVSLLPALINTVFMTILALSVAVPIGIGASIYLVEYARRDNPFVSVIRIATETLSGIPSIIYGLFGALFFVKFAHMGLSLLSGAVTLSIMILPLIMRTTEEALLSGIFSGIILAIGRIVGESAALIFTAGTVAEVAKSIFSSSRTLAVHMYAISGEGLYVNQTYATAVILLVLVIIINLVSGLIARRLGSKTSDE